MGMLKRNIKDLMISTEKIIMPVFPLDLIFALRRSCMRTKLIIFVHDSIPYIGYLRLRKLLSRAREIARAEIRLILKLIEKKYLKINNSI